MLWQLEQVDLHTTRKELNQVLEGTGWQSPYVRWGLSGERCLDFDGESRLCDIEVLGDRRKLLGPLFVVRNIDGAPATM